MPLIKQEVGESVGGSLGMTPEDSPWWYDALENVPGLPTTMGWGVYRQRNTIMKGGWADRRKRSRLTGRAIDSGKFQRWRSTNLRLGSFTRLPSASMMHPTTGYSPFQGARMGNWLARNFGGRVANTEARGLLMGSRKGFAVSAAGEASEVFDNTGEAFNSGFMGRWSASSKVRRSGVRGMRQAESISSFLNMGGIGLGPDDVLNPANRGLVRNSLLMSNTGRVTGHMAGMISGVRGPLDDASRQMAMKMGRDHFIRGAARGEAWARPVYQAAGREFGEKLGIKGATKGLAQVATKQGAKAGFRGAAAVGLMAIDGPLPIGDAIAAAMLAYDIGKMAASIGSGTVKLAGDAYNSYTGGMNSPILGGVFKDTEAAMTARSRGVMAIQNSRLNARSVLGAEAGQMAAHFG
ncbi:MAG TPA: hypothetical protein VJ742_12350 [Nitrososphaera sp.]|nr:hypothetical protein [Nitrososphaera sp.]